MESKQTLVEQEKIWAYLKGEMSPAETEEFIAKVEKSSNLQAEVELQRMILQGITEDAKADLRSRIQVIQQTARGEEKILPESPVQHQKRIIRAPNWGWIAFGVAASLGLFFLFKFVLYDQPSDVQYIRSDQNQQQQEEELALAVRQMIAEEKIHMLSGDPEWSNLFREKNYEEVIRFTQIAPIQTPALNYYQGFSYLKIDMPEKAIGPLSLAMKDSTWHLDAKWNLSLALIQLDSTSQARDHLESLQVISSKYQSKVNQLLNLMPVAIY